MSKNPCFSIKFIRRQRFFGAKSPARAISSQIRGIIFEEKGSGGIGAIPPGGGSEGSKARDEREFAHSRDSNPQLRRKIRAVGSNETNTKTHIYKYIIYVRDMRAARAYRYTRFNKDFRRKSKKRIYRQNSER